MLRLYDYLESGNAYKVRLLLHQLGRPFERVDVDILKGESRTQAFLQRSPNGRIPLLELEDGTCLAESSIAVLRFWHHAGLLERNRAAIPEKRERGVQALAVMDRHLAERRFFVGDSYSIADIALYAYTHVAHQGGFELSDQRYVRDWLERVRARPGHVPIAYAA